MEEGSEAAITSDNIKVLPDFEKLGISSAAVLFHIIEFPKHGELSFGQNIKKRKVFSLAQLRSNKVLYIHNGKENVGDSFVFEIKIEKPGPGSISADHEAVSSLMTVRQRYLFEIRILPVNDVPVVRGTLGSVLMMAAGTKMTLPSQFLQVRNEYHFSPSLPTSEKYFFSPAKFLFPSGEVISSLY